ncbi:MAG: NUDIX domain-containing protein [Candidatus Aenigmatarchaeota archaeon]
MREKVLVVPRDILFKQKNFQGFLTIGEFNFLPIIRSNAFFKERRLVENDPSLKQIIPYQVLMIRNKIFLYQRINSKSEKRYLGKFSLGIGGHINPKDGKELLDDARKREFLEEINYKGRITSRLIGFVNDDSNPLGSVHFGVVYLLNGSSEKIKIKENKNMQGKLVPFKEAKKYLEKMESWSAIVYRHLSEGQ